MNEPHWMLKRVLDPIKKIMEDLQYVDFRGSLLLATVGNSFCVHDKCVKTFKKVNFFGIDGGKYDIIPVRDQKDSESHGAEGFMCCCNQEDKENMIAELSFRHG